MILGLNPNILVTKSFLDLHICSCSGLQWLLLLDDIFRQRSISAVVDNHQQIGPSTFREVQSSVNAASYSSFAASTLSLKYNMLVVFTPNDRRHTFFSY